jgi:Domain of unknown function (DUF4160)
MPTILRERGYRFFFYADDRSEPVHVHVQREARTANFWLEIEDTNFTNSHESVSNVMRFLKSCVHEIRDNWYNLCLKWHDFFGD